MTTVLLLNIWTNAVIFSDFYYLQTDWVIFPGHQEMEFISLVLPTYRQSYFPWLLLLTNWWSSSLSFLKSLFCCNRWWTWHSNDPTFLFCTTYIQSYFPCLLLLSDRVISTVCYYLQTELFPLFATTFRQSYFPCLLLLTDRVISPVWYYLQTVISPV